MFKLEKSLFVNCIQNVWNCVCTCSLFFWAWPGRGQLGREEGALGGRYASTDRNSTFNNPEVYHYMCSDSKFKEYYILNQTNFTNILLTYC